MKERHSTVSDRTTRLAEIRSRIEIGSVRSPIETVRFLLGEIAELEAKYNFMVDSAQQNGRDRDLNLTRLIHADSEITKLRQVLFLIAAPKREDGSYNRCREACEVLARDALASAYADEKELEEKFRSVTKEGDRK